ncbi:MAG: ABC transporter permease [Bacteroidales bacterium]|nr:ABC transporter permease [Bacteroidales bacterium]
MTFLDITQIGFSNLWKTRLRTALTILGVVIGIGALTSMVSFGTGMQKNITDAFKKNDLFTSMNVTPGKINLESIQEGDLSGLSDLTKEKPFPLTDSILEVIRAIPEVEIAFPEETFAARIQFKQEELNTNVRIFPTAMQYYSPFNNLLAGQFYSSDSTRAVVVSWETLKNLGIYVEDPTYEFHFTHEDSLKGATIISPDSVLGKKIQIITASINPNIIRNPFGFLMGNRLDPFGEHTEEFEIIGITRRYDDFNVNRFRAGIYMPVVTAKNIPRLNFSSVWDILDSNKKDGTFSSIYVRVKEINAMTKVREQIEAMGAGVFSIADQLKEIKRGFLIMDSLLGAIGSVALIIAALGIINTMLMSILERTREIGIMKAIGGSENEIKLIFFVEAAFIGFIGAIFGLGLGWLVTRIANQIINAQLIPMGQIPVDLFYFPLWLIFGAMVFSIVISLAAGLYPAIRAARIDPVRALRHD